MNIVVAIATINRSTVLSAMLSNLAKQVRGPDRIIICGSKPEDVAGATTACRSAEVIYADAGGSTQRNAIIHAAIDSDVILFLDDDFFPQPDYILAVERHLENYPKTVVVTGEVIADGINGPGLSVGDAETLLLADAQQYRTREAPEGETEFAGYGCNMAVRTAAIRQGKILFDEALPLYSWQEDVDLSRRLAEFGDVVKLKSARGVHLGVKSGRGSGLKLGYSQVANPIYLASKRAGYPFVRAFGHVGKNMAKNVLRSPWPEPYVDRRGRLRGNLLALWDLSTGRMSPLRVLEM
jgi:GT2 family glycosyltransferase